MHDVSYPLFRAHVRLRLELWDPARGPGWQIPSTHSFWSIGISISGGPAVAATDYRGGLNKLSAATVALVVARARNEINIKNVVTNIKRYVLRLSALLMFHNRVTDFCVWQGHDACCDALHLDQAVLPVSLVVHPVTGAQRVITQGMITALSNTITKTDDVR